MIAQLLTMRIKARAEFWWIALIAIAHGLLSLSVRAISHHHLRQFSVNTTAITVTAFAYSPSQRPPEWVDKTLGSQAVFWRIDKPYFSIPGGIQSVRNARARWRNHMQLPDYAALPACSVEMIGFARLGPHAPFRGKEDRMSNPSAGRVLI